MNQFQKGNSLVIAIILVLVLIIAGTIIWKLAFKSDQSPKTSPTSIASTPASTPSPEVWQRNDKIIFNTTSTSTHKLADGTYRMYFMQKGQIVYADSSDGTNFSTPISTGITEEKGKMISNPSVLEVTPGNWIMIYEIQPQKQPGQNEQVGTAATQRDLYLATSSDGKKFSSSGIAIDSSKEKDDQYFASVPDLVKLPDGKIRLYYVSSPEAIGSAISSDAGKTWTREDGYRLEDKAVDPDVLLSTKNGKTQYLMYYSVLTGPGNALYKSTSTDGLSWTKGIKILDSINKNTSIIDPDVVEIDSNKYRMFFGEMGGDSTSQEPSEPNLYYANFIGNIFN